MEFSEATGHNRLACSRDPRSKNVHRGICELRWCEQHRLDWDVVEIVKMRKIHLSIGSRLCVALLFAWLGACLWSNPSLAADAKTIVRVMNVMYGNVVNASVEG
jgi:hypothetical protein